MAANFGENSPLLPPGQQGRLTQLPGLFIYTDNTKPPPPPINTGTRTIAIPQTSGNEAPAAAGADAPPSGEQSTLKIIKEFLHIFSRAKPADKSLLVMALAATIGHGLCFLAFALILGQVTQPFVQQSLFGYGKEGDGNSTSPNGNATTLLTKSEFTSMMKDYSIYYIFIAVAVFALSFLQTYLWEMAAENQCYHMKEDFVSNVLRQQLDWFKTYKPVSLSATLNDSIANVREGIGYKFSMVLQYATICGVQIAFALWTNWQLTMLFLTISPLPVVFAKFLNFGKLLAKKGETEQEKYAKADGKVLEVLDNIPRVLAFGKENFEVERYRQLLQEAALMAVNKYMVQSIGVGVFLILLLGSYAIAFKKACVDLANHSADISDIYIIFFTVTIAVFALSQILPWITTIAAAQGSAKAIGEILDYPAPIIDASRIDNGSAILPKLSGNLKFNNVTFAYPSNPYYQVLEGLTLEFKPGQTVGIIGRSRAGKTTLANLMFRFFDPSSGSISVDGVIIRDLTLAWYRSKFAILGQTNVEFFNGKILDNICTGTKGISFAKVKEAAELVGVDEFIQTLDGKYEADIEALSGVSRELERVKVAIVRALVRNPLWLIFDEKIQTLPKFKEIFDKIKIARKDLVTIYIGGKTDTVKWTDIIHFLDDGKIVESGTHDQLMELKGNYFALYQSERAPTFDHALTMLPRLIACAPEIDDPFVAKIAADAKAKDQNYPGFWKMLTVGKSSAVDWTFWGLAAFGCLLAGLIVPLFADIYTDIFSEFAKTSSGLSNEAMFWTMMLLCLAIIGGIGFWMRALFVPTAGEYMINRLQKLSFRSILARPRNWFLEKENTPTNLSIKLTEGVPVIRAALDNRFSIAMSGIFTISAAIVFTVLLELQFGLALLLCVFLIVALVYTQIWWQRESQRVSVAMQENANLVFKESAKQMWTVQMLSMEPEINQKYVNLIYGGLVSCRKASTFFAIMHALSETIIYLLLGSVFYYGAHLIDVEGFEPIVFFRAFLIITFCLITFEHTTAFIPDYSKAELAFGHIMDLIQGEGTYEFDRLEKQGPIALKYQLEETIIEFSNVAYTRPGDMSPEISNCSFSIPSKSVVAIAGSGSGKITLLFLLLRFHKPKTGQITLGGKNIEEYDLADLRGIFGYVPAYTDFFNDSIAANILYGYQENREGNVEPLERKRLVSGIGEFVGLDGFASKLINGYDTNINDCTEEMTELVKRKILFARALIRKPKILLLDDPTIYLNYDEQTEIENLITKVKEGRTVIILTGEQSVVKIADLVGWFRDTTMKQFGSHEELAADPDPHSPYRDFMSHQESEQPSMSEIPQWQPWTDMQPETPEQGPSTILPPIPEESQPLVTTPEEPAP